MQMPSFMIPAGETGIASPDEVERRRLVALALMRQGMDTSPTDMWGGAARLGQSVVGALLNKKADRQERAGRDDANKNFNAIMEKLMGPSSASMQPAGGEVFEPTPYEAQGIPDPRSPEFNVIDDRNLPVDPAMISPGPQPEVMPPQQPQVQPQGADIAQQVGQLPMDEIFALMENPYLQPEQAQFLQSVVKGKLDSGEWLNAGQGVIFNTKTGERKQIAPRPSDVQVIQDRATGEIIAIDRNDPNAQPRVIRQGGLDSAAPSMAMEATDQAPASAGAPPAKAQTLPKLTEQQSKDSVFFQRGRNAADTLDKLETALTGYKDNLLDYAPIINNKLTSTEYQLANQAAREFLAVILRKDTGAAVTDTEMDIYGKTFIPQRGEPPEVIAQKREARRVALQAIESVLGAAARTVPPDPNAIPEGLEPEVWDAMTPEERALWQN